MPVEPVDASTVILVRHGEPVGSPWQCFMVRRHVRSDFAADVYVFPGGKVDPEDADPALLRWVEGHPSPENQPEGAEVWRALRLAAVRELFEEAGVLLAVRQDGAVVVRGGRKDNALDGCLKRRAVDFNATCSTDERRWREFLSG